MTVTKQTIIRALKEAVMYAPYSTLPCNRLQSFKVLERGGLIVSENLGATVCDIQKDWFWSRSYDSKRSKTGKVTWELPVLLVIERGFTLSDPLTHSGKQCVNYNITVLDKYTADCEKGDCRGCNGRTINDIYLDTETMLFEALSYLSGMLFVRIEDDIYSMHSQELQHHISEGTVTEHEILKMWGANLASSVKNGDGYKTSIDAESLYGTSINITMCNSKCVNPDWNFTKAKFK